MHYIREISIESTDYSLEQIAQEQFKKGLAQLRGDSSTTCVEQYTALLFAPQIANNLNNNSEYDVFY